MTSTQDLDRLLQELTVSFGVRAPRLVLHHASTQERRGEGFVHGVYDVDQETIRLWVHTPRKLAHEFGHHLQKMYGCPWPVSRRWLHATYPKLCALAADRLRYQVDVEWYSEEAFEEELFARVFERVYLQLTQ